jgi:GT2 family glycosyltransferase
VVITRDRRAQLAETLRELGHLAERPAVIVVDNASSDGTAAMVRADFPNVRLVCAPANLGSAGRTIGVALATTPYAAFCDDDACWQPGSLARAAALLDEHPHVAAIAGSVVVGPERRADPISTVMACSPLTSATVDLPGPGVVGMPAMATMVRCKPFLDVHGFHPRYGVGGEERLLALDLRAAGWHVCFVAEVVVHHRPLQEGREPASRRRRMVRNDLWTAWLRYPWRDALAATADILRSSVREHGASTAWAASVDAIGGWRWARRERAPVPAAVMAELSLVARAAPGPVTARTTPRAR